MSADAELFRISKKKNPSATKMFTTSGVMINAYPAYAHAPPIDRTKKMSVTRSSAATPSENDTMWSVDWPDSADARRPHALSAMKLDAITMSATPPTLAPIATSSTSSSLSPDSSFTIAGQLSLSGAAHTASPRQYSSTVPFRPQSSCDAHSSPTSAAPTHRLVS